jgi:hypothetical protein
LAWLAENGNLENLPRISQARSALITVLARPLDVPTDGPRLDRARMEIVGGPVPARTGRAEWPLR